MSFLKGHSLAVVYFALLFGLINALFDQNRVGFFSAAALFAISAVAAFLSLRKLSPTGPARVFCITVTCLCGISGMLGLVAGLTHS